MTGLLMVRLIRLPSRTFLTSFIWGKSDCAVIAIPCDTQHSSAEQQVESPCGRSRRSCVHVCSFFARHRIDHWSDTDALETPE